MTMARVPADVICPNEEPERPSRCFGFRRYRWIRYPNGDFGIEWMFTPLAWVVVHGPATRQECDVWIAVRAMGINALWDERENDE